MRTIEIIQDDITKIAADAIVNAANTSLLGGGGVDGAIHRAGESKILQECMAIRLKQGGCKVGEAVITTAGNLPATYVIHTVGPIWKGGDLNEDQLLANCYINCLNLAIKHQLKTIAFPNISTGVYHFPKQRAAEIAKQTVNSFLIHHPDCLITKISFICFDEENYKIYKEIWT